MQTEVIVALITLIGTSVGTISGILVSAKLTAYRLEQLEKKMDKHNGLMERMFKLEERVCGVEDDVSRMRKE